eukprot:99139_1
MKSIDSKWCIKLAIVALQELCKSQIYAFNATQWMTFKSKSLRFDLQSKLNLQRVDRKSTYGHVMQTMANNYQIPPNQQIIFSYSLQFPPQLIQRDFMSLNDALFDTTKDINLIVMDKRKVGSIHEIYDHDTQCPSTASGVLILKYYDIIEQRMNVVDIITIHTLHLYARDLIQYIYTTLLGKFSNEKWCEVLSKYFKTETSYDSIHIYTHSTEKCRYSNTMISKCYKMTSHQAIRIGDLP